MGINTKYVWPLAALLGATSIGTASLLAYKAQSERQQVDFITRFYQGYLADARRTPPPAGSFYSAELEALLAANHALCGRLAHDDEICGYDADGDVLLDAQETAPGLDFQQAGFKAVHAGRARVDASFSIFPGAGNNYQRQIRFVLKREDGGWRVDNMLFGANGVFTETNAMRPDILHENQALLARARTGSGSTLKAGAPP
ncbi:hypothetical protein [Rugamonas aquatica]|uniref:DUF3828 domain-containing protein n=1 Tax=Rugamonas aquatica TaxID=2743357 RepID=A0A6A7MZK1_9BURK|nr:hypothetical protein [Rugamonas aquatica]MQA38100.1 hypothetical protein [Rugamonas aquatica]